MKIINQFDDVKNLPLSDTIKALLIEQLVAPFDDEPSAAAMWQEINVSLFLLEETDTDESLETQAEDVQHFIRFITRYPEFVGLLDDGQQQWLLALAVVTSDGGGIYCCAPMSSTTLPVRTLSQHIES